MFLFNYSYFVTLLTFNMLIKYFFKEPASHRSTPIDTGPLASSQQFDNLEGQFTPSAGVPSKFIMNV